MMDLTQLDEQIRKWGTSFLGFHADMQPDFERAILDAFSGFLPFDVPDHISPIAQALLYRFLFDPQLVHFDEHVLWETLRLFDQAVKKNQKAVAHLLKEHTQEHWTAVLSLIRFADWWPKMRYEEERREEFILRHLVPHYVLTYQSIYAPLLTMAANLRLIRDGQGIMKRYADGDNAMQKLSKFPLLLRYSPWRLLNMDDEMPIPDNRPVRKLVRHDFAHSSFHLYDESPFPEIMVFPKLAADSPDEEHFFHDEQVIGMYEELLDDCSALALCLVWAEEELSVFHSPQGLTALRARRSMESKLHVILKCVLEPSKTKVIRAWSQRQNEIDTFYAQLHCFPARLDGQFALLRAAACAQSLVQNAGFCATVEAGISKLAWISGLFMVEADELNGSLASPTPPKSNSLVPDRGVVALGILKKACEMSHRFRFAALGVKWEGKLKALQKLKDRFNWPLPRKKPPTHLDRSVQFEDSFQIVHGKGWPANSVKEVEFGVICPKGTERDTLRQQIPDLICGLKEHEVRFQNPHNNRQWKGKPAQMLTACFYLRRPRENVLQAGRCSERKCAIAKVEWHYEGNGPYWVESHETLSHPRLSGPIHVEWTPTPRWQSL